MIIPVEVFNRLLYNAILFSPTDSMVGGVAKWVITPWGLSVTASDNFIIYDDIYTAHQSVEFEEFFLTRKSMQELEKATRCFIEGEELEIHIDDDVLQIGSKALVPIPVAYEKFSDEEFWQSCEDLVQNFLAIADRAYPPNNSVSSYAVSPERLGRVCRIKTDGDWPMDVGFNQSVVGFKIGPTAKAFLAPLVRENLKKDGLW
jgi:hypothetical protein